MHLSSIRDIVVVPAQAGTRAGSPIAVGDNAAGIDSRWSLPSTPIEGGNDSKREHSAREESLR